ncbi:MAG: L-threonylcarbamoyladenylate synthase [Thermoanaerobaculales bacterium]|jgi:tRNA threonylcarbamoyl adenosine modification protein (Sua5/YciO/YrdC/YwlC family)|nr:L-threonylcarbamoyladenylate synthase [Thermoanaerobaculales bacterium]
MISLPFREKTQVRDALEAAAEVVAAGGVILIPTESFYGLGADPGRAEAVARVVELKGRPVDLGLPVVCCDWSQVESLVEIPPGHRIKLSRLWPAALSVIATARRPSPASRAGTLAVRIPGHDHLRALLYRTGPLTATSANRHGHPPGVRVEEALQSLHGTPDLVLDGGELAGGQVSTMVDLASEEGCVIRPGAVGWEQSFDLEEWVLQEC